MRRGTERIVGWAAVGVLLLFTTGTVRADVIYNNLGPGDTYQTGVGWTLGLPGTYQDVGNRFTPAGTSYTLDTIALALGYVTGTNAVDVALMTDAGGLPGLVIESWHVTNLPPFGSSNPPVVVNSVLHPLLTDGTPYYVVVSVPLGESTWAAWNWNSTNDVGQFAFRSNGGPWNLTSDVRGAYRVEGSPVVPEPSTLVLCGLGVFGPLGYAWRRRRVQD